MAESPHASGGSRADHHTPDMEITGWAGRVAFAGGMLILLGGVQVIEGLVALVIDGFYVLARDGLVVDVDHGAWGWTHFLLGVVAIAVGFGLIAGNVIARVAGIAIAMTSAILNVAFISAYPVWSTFVIAVDAVVICVIVVDGRERRSANG